MQVEIKRCFMFSRKAEGPTPAVGDLVARVRSAR